MAKKKHSQAGNGHALLTPEDVARELAVSRAWVRDHVSGRRLPKLKHIWLGGKRGQIRFRRADIERFLNANVRNDAQ